MPASESRRLCPRDDLPLIDPRLLDHYPGDNLIGTLVDDRYALYDRLTLRLPGQAYAALRLPDNVEVTLHAFLPDDGVTRPSTSKFQTILEVLERLRSPGLLVVLGYGRLGDEGFYVVTENCMGTTLDRYLATMVRPAGWPAAYWPVKWILEALVDAHSRNMAHGAMNPAKILLRDHGGSPPLSVMGFGFDLLETTEASNAGLDSRIHLDAKAAAYMSPEEIQLQPTSPASDVYSIGCILFHLVTGKLPYPGPKPLDMVAGHLSGRFPVGELDEAGASELGPVLSRASALRPGDRFANAGEMLEALDAVPRRTPSPPSAGSPGFDWCAFLGCASPPPEDARPVLLKTRMRRAWTPSQGSGPSPEALVSAKTMSLATVGQTEADLVAQTTLPDHGVTPGGDARATTDDHDTVEMPGLVHEERADSGGDAPTIQIPGLRPDVTATPMEARRPPDSRPEADALEASWTMGSPLEIREEGFRDRAEPGGQSQSPEEEAAATVQMPGLGAASSGPETVLLEALDPEVVNLQQEFEERQREEQFRRLTEERKAKRLERHRALMIKALVVGAALLLGAAVGLFVILSSRDDTLELDPELQAFLDGLDEPQEELPPPEPDPSVLRPALEKDLAELADMTWDRLQKLGGWMAVARHALESGARDRTVKDAADTLLGLVKEMKAMRREALELKVGLGEAEDDAVPGISANARRLRVNLVELDAVARAAIDELREHAKARGPRRAPTRRHPSGAGAPTRPSTEQPAQPTRGPSNLAVTMTKHPEDPSTLSDEELLARVLGAGQHSKEIRVPGHRCPCRLDDLASGGKGDELSKCELEACWAVPPGNPRFAEVAYGLARYHGARRQYKKQLLGLMRATRYGKYSHDPEALFELMATALRVGRFEVALDAKDRFMYVKHLLPPARREVLVPEAFKILGQAFEMQYYRLAEDDPAKADEGLLNRAIDYLERYLDLRADPKMQVRLDELRRIRDRERP